MVRGVPKLDSKHSPFKAATNVNRATFAIDDEDANVINVLVKLKDANGRVIKHNGCCELYLASSPTTLAPATSLPTIAIAGGVGTLFRNGTLGAITALTDSTVGTANNTLEAVADVATAGGNTYADSVINAVIAKLRNNFADLAAKVNELIGLNPVMRAISDDDGEISLDITKTGAATYYLVALLPGGGVDVSEAITFV